MQLNQQVKAYAPNGSIILNDESGRPLFSQRPEQALIPASIIKIVTALAAFDLLGKDYRFQTDFYLDSQGALLIKGWGDPFLISEEIAVIGAKIKEKGISTLTQIFLDPSAFTSGIKVPGTNASANPYDALNGALAVNFNTLNIGKAENGSVISAEDVTPLTPLAEAKGEYLAPATTERFNLTKDPEESLRYVGELFTAIFEQAGVTIQNHNLSAKERDSSHRLLYRHQNSHSLETVFEGLMKYSNNYIANQVFLVMGGEKLGYPASLTKSQAVLKAYLETKWDFGGAETFIEEASGISARNRMNAIQMIQVLESFRPFSHLLATKNGIKVKSGTLTGVYNYAGYFLHPRGLRPFVIMTNQKKNKRDKILKTLQKISELL